MKLFKSSKSTPSNLPSLAEAEDQLAQCTDALQTAQAARDEAEQTLAAAELDGKEPDDLLQLEAAFKKADTTYERAQRAHNAASERLEAVKESQLDQQHKEKVDRLDATLKQRRTLAGKLAKNSKERAELMQEFGQTDKALHELRNVISPNATTELWSINRLLSLLDLEDSRAGVPGGRMFGGSMAINTSLAEQIERDNKLMKGE